MEERYICDSCGKENPSGSKFCVFCGSRVILQPLNQNVCPKCGNVLTEGAIFCNACGNQVTGSDPAPVKQQPVQDGLFHDRTFGSDVRPDYDKKPAEPPNMSGYYREEKMRRKNERPEKVKKEKSPREGGSRGALYLIPVILLIVAVISAFIVTWLVTAVIAVIAVIVLFLIKRKRPKTVMYDEMGYT